MVDIWLIFTQLYPFVMVILYTIIELYNEEEETNHHGFKRDIPETQRQNGKWKIKNLKLRNLYKISKGFGKYDSFLKSKVLYGLDLYKYFF